MADDSDEAANRPIRENARVKRFIIWIQIILLGLLVPGILATSYLPHAIGMAVSSIIEKFAIIVFLCAVPFLEVVLWKAIKGLPHNEYWGFAFLFIGAGALQVAIAVYLFFDTFLPALFQPSPFVVGVFVVMGAGFTSALLGLLIVCIRLAREFVRLFRERRQARIGGEQ